MKDGIWTVRYILAWIENYLTDRGDRDAAHAARWLVAEALSTSQIQLYADLDRPLTAEERSVLRTYTKRRAAGEPLQYITGTTDFRFITIKVRSGVLIPRPETEVLVSEALAELRHKIAYQRDVQTVPAEKLHVIDACTGTGCIACSIAREVPWAHVVATDISPDAVALAQENVADLHVADRVHVLLSDIMEGVPTSWCGGVDLVISNPPYVPTSVLAHMSSEVTEFEPLLALDGGIDGLTLYRRLLAQAKDVLAPDGVLAVELHETCLDAAAVAAQHAGFTNVRQAIDLAGRPRVLIAHKEESCQTNLCSS